MWKCFIQCSCFHVCVRITWCECWCNHNNNENNTTRNWIILLNIINIKKKKITQHNLDWGAALALFKEIQAFGWLNFITGADLLWLVFGWLNFVTGADLLWLVSPRIQQPNKCCMARTTSALSVQAQSSTRKNTLPCQESLYFFFMCIVNCCNLDWVWMSLFIGSMGLTKLLPNLFWFN